MINLISQASLKGKKASKKSERGKGGKKEKKKEARGRERKSDNYWLINMATFEADNLNSIFYIKPLKFKMYFYLIPGHIKNKYLMITAYMGCDYFTFKFHASSPMY